MTEGRGRMAGEGAEYGGCIRLGIIIIKFWDNLYNLLNKKVR